MIFIATCPHPTSVHTENRQVYDSVISCTRRLRGAAIKHRVAHNTIKSKECWYDIRHCVHPNVSVTISTVVDCKIYLMGIYAPDFLQIQIHAAVAPFPVSLNLGRLPAGTQCGYLSKCVGTTNTRRKP